MLHTTIPAVRQHLASFHRDEDASIAVIFALVMIPILGITATALDYGRASRVKSTLSRAADAAVLEVATNLTRSDTTIEEEVRRQLDANLPSELQGIQFKMHIPSNRAFVEITLETTVNTSLAAVLGVMKLNLEVAAKAERVKYPSNGKVTPEMAKEMEQQLRWMIRQAQQGALGAGGFGGAGGELPANPR